MESECSLMLDSEICKVKDRIKNMNTVSLLTASELSFQEVIKQFQEKATNEDTSLYSLFKDSQATEEYNSYISYRQEPAKLVKAVEKARPSTCSQHKSIDFSRYTSTTWKGYSAVKMDSTKSTKSVTFTSQDNHIVPTISPTGRLIEPMPSPTAAEEFIHSISTKGPVYSPGQNTRYGLDAIADSELWLAFLTEAGERQASEVAYETGDVAADGISKNNAPDSMMYHFFPRTIPMETIEMLETMETLSSAHLRQQYESIHRRNPGLFWDTVNMDNGNDAFKKVRRIIRDIVNNQKFLKPMFDIDFPNLNDYPTVKKRLESIREQIAPKQLFY